MLSHMKEYIGKDVHWRNGEYIKGMIVLILWFPPETELKDW